MRIIPAIDIIDGKCVRLTKGEYSSKKIYNESPVEVAKEMEQHGIRYLHVVDLDGAKAKSIVNLKTLERICADTNLHVDFGGGIKATADVQSAFDAGAKQVTGGSIAALDRIKFLDWLENFGSEKIILGADCRENKIATLGWEHTSTLNVHDYIKDYYALGISYVICTDISKDGMLEGPATDLYKQILAQSPVKLIASGGVSSIADLQELKKAGCDGAVIGKAIYENKITLKELEILC